MEVADRGVDGLFSNGVLSFNSAVAHAYSEIVARRRVAGIAGSRADGQVPAIARINGVAIAIRYVRDSESGPSNWVRTIS